MLEIVCSESLKRRRRTKSRPKSIRLQQLRGLRSGESRQFDLVATMPFHHHGRVMPSARIFSKTIVHAQYTIVLSWNRMKQNLKQSWSVCVVAEKLGHA